MNFTREGEWMVSTPIYVGDLASIEKAKTCSHEYRVRSSEVKDGILMVVEHCYNCVAVRMKYRPGSVGDGDGHMNDLRNEILEHAPKTYVNDLFAMGYRELKFAVAELRRHKADGRVVEFVRYSPSHDSVIFTLDIGRTIRSRVQEAEIVPASRGSTCEVCGKVITDDRFHHFTREHPQRSHFMRGGP